MGACFGYDDGDAMHLGWLSAAVHSIPPRRRGICQPVGYCAVLTPKELAVSARKDSV